MFSDMCSPHLCGVERWNGPRIAGAGVEHNISLLVPSRSLQPPQEPDNTGVLVPLLGVAGLWDIAMGKCLGFHLQVDFGIDMRCI